MKRFFRELQQRGVLRIVGFYIALLWLVLQVGDVVLPAFELPDSMLRYALYAGLLGLPIVAFLSWFYEITPEGILTEEEAREHGAPRKSNHTLTVVTIATLVVALAVSLYVNFQQAVEDLVDAHRGEDVRDRVGPALTR